MSDGLDIGKKGELLIYQTEDGKTKIDVFLRKILFGSIKSK